MSVKIAKDQSSLTLKKHRFMPIQLSTDWISFVGNVLINTKTGQIKTRKYKGKREDENSI